MGRLGSGSRLVADRVDSPSTLPSTGSMDPRQGRWTLDRVDYTLDRVDWPYRPADRANRADVVFTHTPHPPCALALKILKITTLSYVDKTLS